MAETRKPLAKSPVKRISPFADSETLSAEYEREIEKLQVQVNAMEEELRQTRQARGHLEQAFRQNEKLTGALTEARNRIEALKVEVENSRRPRPATRSSPTRMPMARSTSTSPAAR